MGGGESRETIRKRQLRWRQEKPKAYRRMRARQKRRYYDQFQKNNRRRFKRWTPAEIDRITAKDRPRPFGTGNPESTLHSVIISLMCGRYRLSHRKQLIADHFDATGEEEWTPRYNRELHRISPR